MNFTKYCIHVYGLCIYIFITFIDHTADKEPSNQFLPTVQVAVQQLYNEHHPLVEKFVASGFSLDNSIAAVTQCNANAEAALKFLFSSETGGSLFGDAQPSADMPTNSNTSCHQR